MQRLTLDVGHDVEEERVRLARIKERQDVRVLEVRGGLDLSQEALGPDYGCQFGLQDLERDFTLVLEVVGEVDGRHAAFAELALDVVAAL